MQGVFFRTSTRDKATGMGLTGWVRNTRNGDVEVVACGEANQLSQLEDWLRNGPPFADVRDVQSESIARETFINFSVRS